MQEVENRFFNPCVIRRVEGSGGGRAWTLGRPTACKTISYQTNGYTAIHGI
jgi:hypothetical protein